MENLGHFKLPYYFLVSAGGLYGLTVLLSVLKIYGKKSHSEVAEALSFISMRLGWLAHLVGILVYWSRSDMGALWLSYYGMLVYASWMIVGINLFFEIDRQFFWVRIVNVLLACIPLSVSLFHFQQIDQNLVPQFQSFWFALYSWTLATAMAILFFSAICGILISAFPYQRLREIFRFDAQDEVLDIWILKSIRGGFALIAVVLFSGLVWQHYAYGTYWSWSQRETWLLIVWVYYAVYVFSRSEGADLFVWIKWLPGIGMVFILYYCAVVWPVSLSLH